jgi:hypothetical protein
MSSKQVIIFAILISLTLGCQVFSKKTRKVIETPHLSNQEIKAAFDSETTDTIAIVILDEPAPQKADVVASIKKTACYGLCPVFEIKIFSNGLALYNGEKHTTRLGLYEAYLLQSEIDDLMAKADTVNFFQLASAYPSEGRSLNDLPNTVTYLKKESQEKEIVNNHGAPRALKSYEILLLEKLTKLDWRPVIEID